MKTQKNIILDSINYLKNFVPTHKEFNTYKHIGRAVSNPLNVSYISQGKINGIKENTGVVIGNRPTAEQRKKYFTQTSINKLLKKLFVINTSEESKKLETISQEVDDFLKSSLDYEFKIFDNVPEFYAKEKENYNGSCMAGKNKLCFGIYDLINQSKKVNVKMAAFVSGEEILARALIWCETNKIDKICENSGDILETIITNKKFYLDRIYINNKLQNVCFSEMQHKLFKAVRQAYKIEALPCYNKSHIESYILNKYYHKNTEKFKFMCDRVTPDFIVSLDFDEVMNLNAWPYLDTFRYLDECGYLSHLEDDVKIIFDQTNGDYTEAGKCCDNCGVNMDTDDQIYSDLDDEYLCHDCAIYIDERGEYCNESNAVYNDYSGSYHYAHDLDR